MEKLSSLLEKMDRSAIGAELPMRLAGLPKKLGLDIAGAYGSVMSRDSGAKAPPLEAAVKVLQKLGLEPGYLAGDEPCCGAPLYSTGLHEDFAANARRGYDKFKAAGVREIIGLVPSCTYALRDIFPDFVEGYDIKVRHFAEVVAVRLASLELKYPENVKVTYHDPCQMARYLKLVDEPRAILKAIKNIELVEPDWTKGEWATCCGGGGGFEVVFPELSRMLAANRAGELLETGAEIIVTSCPGCALQLRAGLEAQKAGGVEVLDLSQVVATAMGIEI